MVLKDFLKNQGQAQPVDPASEFRTAYEKAMQEGAKDRAYWNRVYMGLEEQGRNYFGDIPEAAKDGTIAACGKTFLRDALNQLPLCTLDTHFAAPYARATTALSVLRHAPSILLEDEEVGDSYENLIKGLKEKGAQVYADGLLRQLREAAGNLVTFK